MEIVVILVIAPLVGSHLYLLDSKWGFPGGSEGKMSACNAGEQGLIPGSGRSPEEGNGNPLQPGSLQSMGSQKVGHD